MEHITRFANVDYLWLLFILLPMVVYYVYRVRNGQATVQVSSVRGIEKVPHSAKYYLRHLPFVLRCLTVAALVVALARPQSSDNTSSTTTEGIDIIISLDISGSMLARDFQPDRMTAAKEMAARFVMDRPNDRMGLVVFEGESFTQCPLTMDKASLVNLLWQARSGILDDGTAIGNGLATAVNRLRESNARSKVVILLTDGVNNAGQIAPVAAAEIAQTYGIRVYTIGIGSEGMAPYPAYNLWGELVFTPQKVEIDEEVLRNIAARTGGKYFRATDNKKLADVYAEINTLETTRIEVENYTRYLELFVPLALAALALLVIEAALKYLYLRRIP